MTTTDIRKYEAVTSTRPAPTQGETPAHIELPRPDLRSGMPLMSALSFRCSTREFSNESLSRQTLGEMLWAADGINRDVTGGRTAPSAHAFNEIDIYVALPSGAYRYDACEHRLFLKRAIDARSMTGYQDFVGAAPLDLVYVVRASKLVDMPPQQRDVFSAVAAGAIAQNVSLYCASAGLGTVVRGWINHRQLADALSLNEDELPILAQTVGNLRRSLPV